jgi:2-aminoadipate transaminase
MQEEFPPQVKYNILREGVFLVILPEDKSAKELLQLALKENVAFVPGCSFFPGKKMHNTIRLNFSNMTMEKLDEGLNRLGRVLKKYLF